MFDTFLRGKVLCQNGDLMNYAANCEICRKIITQAKYCAKYSKPCRAELFSKILTNFSKKKILHGKVKQVKQKLVTALIIWDQFS